MYDQPPGWQFRHFPGQGMHPAIASLKGIADRQEGQQAQLDAAMQEMDDEKKTEFLKLLLRKMASQHQLNPNNPQGYF